MKKFDQFIKGLEESLAYLEETELKPGELSASAAALDCSLRQIEADLVEEDKFFSAAKGHRCVVMSSKRPIKIEKGTLYLTISKDKETIIAQSNYIKPPRNLSKDESKGLQQILTESKEFDLLPASTDKLNLIERLIPICDYSPAQRIENLKSGLKKILKFIIENKGKESYSEIPPGKARRIEKADSKCGYTFFISHNENDEMEIHINEKNKLSKYKREGTSKIVKKTFVFQNNEWERHAGPVIKEVFYYKNIYFQQDELSPYEKNKIIKNHDIAVIHEENNFLIGFVNNENKYQELLLKKPDHKDLISELENIIADEIMTDEKIINSAAVRSKIFSIIQSYTNHHPDYDDNVDKIVSKSGKELGIDREIRLGGKIKSPHVAAVKLLCLYEDKKTGKLKLALDSKLADYDLHDLSEKHLNQVDLIDVYSIIYTAFKGLADTHAAGVIHQDVKTNNILIKKDKDGHFRALIADFGSAVTEEEKDNKIGSATSGYAAPEFWQALLTEGPKSSLASLIGNLFYQYRPFYTQQKEADIALKKFEEEKIPFISDIKPHQSNDVWALALSIKKFLTNFKNSINYDSLDEFNKQNIELLIKSMDNILYSPREKRMNAAQFLSEELPKIISNLATKEAVEINKRLDVLKAMKYSGGGTAETKPEILHKKPESPVSPRLVPTVTISQPPLVIAQTAPLPRPDTKQIESSSSTQDKPQPPAQIKLSSAGHFAYEIEKSFKELEKYKELILQERNGKDRGRKRNYDNPFAFFNPGCDKRQKSRKVGLVIEALTDAKESKEYSEVRDIIAKNSTIFGVFRNGRLSGHINQLKIALALEPNVKSDDSSSTPRTR